mmetsp:Transcript_8269/g.15257  ORF Transcript_8269/g.15257 Transcript_8269/m.15257 type:complete len:368 (-) Transcript_8269:156-1259(-)
MSSSPIVFGASYFDVTTIPLGNITSVVSESVLFVPSWFNLETAPRDVVCFVGFAENLEPDVQSFYGGGGTQCQATNGCGVHVHEGTDCLSTETQGGHWYNQDTLAEDPWAVVGYKATNENGYGQFAGCVSTGFDLASDPTQLQGRAFIIHAEDGSRVSCGIIEDVVADYVPTIISADTTPIPGATSPQPDGVTGFVTVMNDFIESTIDAVCYQGYASGLEPNVESFLLGGGSDTCDVTNGCGSHIHSGTGCNDTDAQGGHYYDADTVAVDPWLLESYYSTNGTGTGAFVGCAITGEGASDYNGRPFIMHGTDGSRLSCGILSASETVVVDPGGDSAANSPFSGMTMIPWMLTSAVVSGVLGFIFDMV